MVGSSNPAGYNTDRAGLQSEDQKDFQPRRVPH
jgi:hypothetical protein